MSSVCKRDLRAWFASGPGYVVFTLALCILNFAFYQYNILGASAHLGKAFAFMPIFLTGFMPLITMQAFAGDFEQKTDRLYASAATGFMGIVFGKFFCGLTLFKLILAGTLLWPITIGLLGGRQNFPAIIGSYLGLVFVGAAYISIGLFISSLTGNKIIAGVGSLGVFLAFYLLEAGNPEAYISLPALLWDGLRFISIQARYENILTGLLSPADLVYFLSLCFLFLFLTAQTLERRHLARGGNA